MKDRFFLYPFVVVVVVVVVFVVVVDVVVVVVVVGSNLFERKGESSRGGKE